MITTVVDRRRDDRGTPSRLQIVSSAFLTKLARHLGLIACLLILGQTSSRSVAGQIGIFLLIVLAAALNATGRALRSRFYGKQKLL
ncbi:MAG TPA: hypothetical protein VFU31_28470 [Candidatus Binatia bacterium]|nr:hypothetical protein [Candidatus Binatia bacterium]